MGRGGCESRRTRRVKAASGGFGGVGDASGKWKLFTNLIVRRAFVLGPYCSTLYLDVLLRPIVAALTVQRN